MECCNIGAFLSGLGSLLTGLAACSAVCIAKAPMETYINKINNTQIVVVNTCKATNEANELIRESHKNPNDFEIIFNKIPSSLSKYSLQPMGLFIAPEFRIDAKKEIKAAITDEDKKKIIEKYWKKSLGKETNKNLELTL